MRKTFAVLAAASMAVGTVAQAAPTDRIGAPVESTEGMGAADGYFPGVPVLLAFAGIIVGLVLILDNDNDFVDSPGAPMSP